MQRRKRGWPFDPATRFDRATLQNQPFVEAALHGGLQRQRFERGDQLRMIAAVALLNRRQHLPRQPFALQIITAESDEIGQHQPVCQNLAMIGTLAARAAGDGAAQQRFRLAAPACIDQHAGEIGGEAVSGAMVGRQPGVCLDQGRAIFVDGGGAIALRRTERADGAGQLQHLAMTRAQSGAGSVAHRQHHRFRLGRAVERHQQKAVGHRYARGLDMTVAAAPPGDRQRLSEQRFRSRIIALHHLRFAEIVERGRPTDAVARARGVIHRQRTAQHRLRFGVARFSQMPDALQREHARDPQVARRIARLGQSQGLGHRAAHLCTLVIMIEAVGALDQRLPAGIGCSGKRGRRSSGGRRWCRSGNRHCLPLALRQHRGGEQRSARQRQ